MLQDLLKTVAVTFLFMSMNGYSLTHEAPERFFSDPDMVSAELSPNGRLIVAISYNKGHQQLILIRVPTKISADVSFNQREVLLDVASISNNKASLRAIQWVDNNSIAVSFSEDKKGIKDLVDTHQSRYLFIVNVPTTKTEPVEILSLKTPGNLIDALPHENDSFLYAKHSAYSKVYKVRPSLLNKYKAKLGKLTKVDGGQFIKKNEVASVEGYTTQWFVGDEGGVEAVLSHGSQGSLILNKFLEDGSTVEIKKWTKKTIDAAKDNNHEAGSVVNKNGEDNSQLIKKLIMPVALADKKDFFYAFDYAEPERKSVYKVNYKTGFEERIYESDSYRIVDIFLSHSDRHLMAVSVIKNGDIRYVYLDHSVQKHIREPGAYSSIISESVDSKRKIVYKESHNRPGEFFFVHERGEVSIGEVFPKLKGPLNNDLYQDTVEVKGLSIPYLLSVPNNIKGKAWPLIVMPHGGPIGIFDSAHFDEATQFINANGYAVLRVNYRGSGGHTEFLKEQGKKQWGRLILEDINFATKEVLLREDIDSSQVCLLGMSYGGYATTALLMKYPDRYHCGVNVSGVSDINLMINGPYMTTRQVNWAKIYIGDSISDHELLKAQSPAFFANQLQRPLLIMHGEKDRVVSIEQAYRLKLVLERLNKPFDWYVFPDAGHHFETNEEKVSLFSKAINFIDRSLATE